MLQISSKTSFRSQASRVGLERQGATLSTDDDTQKSLQRIKEQHPLSEEFQKLLTVLQTIKNDGIKIIIIHHDETEPDKIVVCAKWNKPTGNQYKPAQSFMQTLNFKGLRHKDTRGFLTTLDKYVWNPSQSQNIFSQLWDGMKRDFRVQSLLKSMRNSKP